MLEVAGCANVLTVWEVIGNDWVFVYDYSDLRGVAAVALSIFY